MALDKKLVDNDTRVTCTASPASRRLYDTFGFRPVLPSRPLPPTNAVSSSTTTTAQHQVSGGDDAATNVGEFYSAKEKDSGRVMVSLGFVSTVLQVVSSMLLNSNATSNPGGSGGIQDQVPTPSTSAALSAAAGVEVLDDVVVLPTPSPPPPARRGRGGGAAAAKRGRQ
ncbi:Hypothetical protein, putative [Bodo saltans]|uniref:Uncharacterized protein n=1 Tax=Bodo saltans TaxID=75058 RepID=A0A0S4JAZ4_BODSA|nr:Hypothetical protein, putative [Bodo saltans]|eukprot:CUG88555.1 Hypothetical protein, putative [Bodo saltans]